MSILRDQTRVGKGIGMVSTHDQMGTLEWERVSQSSLTEEWSSAPTATCGPQGEKSPSHQPGEERSDRGPVSEGRMIGWQPLSPLRLSFNPCKPEHLGKKPAQWTVRPAGAVDADGAISGLKPFGGAVTIF